MSQEQMLPDPKSTLNADINIILAHVDELKADLGRSERGRLLSIVHTDLEKVQAFIEFKGL